MIAAWSPAATPRRVWPSTIRASRAAIGMSARSPATSPAPTAGPVHRRDDRLVAVDHVVDQVARLAPDTRTDLEVVGHVLDQREVAAGGESLALSAQDHGADLRIIADVAPDPGEFAMAVVVGGGKLAGPAHHDLEHRLPDALRRSASCSVRSVRSWLWLVKWVAGSSRQLMDADDGCKDGAEQDRHPIPDHRHGDAWASSRAYSSTWDAARADMPGHREQEGRAQQRPGRRPAGGGPRPADDRRADRPPRWRAARRRTGCRGRRWP